MHGLSVQFWNSWTELSPGWLAARHVSLPPSDLSKHYTLRTCARAYNSPLPKVEINIIKGKPLLQGTFLFLIALFLCAASRSYVPLLIATPSVVYLLMNISLVKVTVLMAQ